VVVHGLRVSSCDQGDCSALVQVSNLIYLTLYTISMLEEQKCVQQNLKVIREYLLKAFPGFNLIEDTPEPSVCHRFTLTNAKSLDEFKLKVGWVRLSDLSSDGEMLRRLLVNSDLAGKMRDGKNGQYYYW
jgi:hypothetical protein